MDRISHKPAAVELKPEMDRDTEQPDFLGRAGTIAQRMTLATSVMFSTMTHDGQRVEAADVNDGMQWGEINRALKDDAYTALREQGLGLFLRKDGSLRVLLPVRGDIYKVQHNTGKMRGQIDADITAGNAEAFCLTHVHTAYQMRRILNMPELDPRSKKLYNPPSTLDVSFAEQVTLNILFPPYQIRFTNAVRDPAGLWYYRLATEADYQKNPELVPQFRQLRMIIRSVLGPMENRLKEMAAPELEQLAALLPPPVQKSLAEIAGNKDTWTSNARFSIYKGLLEHNQQLAEYFYKGQDDAKRIYVAVQGEIRNRAARLSQEILIFMRQPVFRKPTEADFNTLSRKYLELAGAYIRFVPDENVEKEKACAG